MQGDRPQNDEMLDQIVTRRSMISGIQRTIVMKFKTNDYIDWSIHRKPIQDALPYLTLDEREFIMTGITKEEWLSQFNKDKAEDRVTPDDDEEDLGDA